MIKMWWRGDERRTGSVVFVVGEHMTSDSMITMYVWLFQGSWNQICLKFMKLLNERKIEIR